LPYDAQEARAVAEDNAVTIYRFERLERGRPISPQRMWGTLEAIASLADCRPIMESARTVHRKLLEDGFYFEQVPTSYRHIDEADRGQAD
jgi:hypothetical protein